VPLKKVYMREGMWATSGRVLWRRRLPPTRFVVVTRPAHAGKYVFPRSGFITS